MTVYFAGGECEAFTVTTGVSESTTGGTYDATYARCSVTTGSSAGVLTTPVFASITTIWVHFEYFQTGNGSGQAPITLLNSSGTPVFRLTTSASATMQPQYWNGAAWVNIGSTFVPLTSTRYICDLKVVGGASGSFEFYIANVLTLSGSASMTSVNNFARVQFRSLQSNTDNWYSQVIVADVATVAWKLHLKPPTGNGANTAWTGDFNDVDETVYNDADFISSAVAGDVETFTRAAITLGTGMVKAVVVSARVKNDGSPPQNIQACLRRAGTNYFSANLPNIGVGFGPTVALFETDPATGVAWTGANATTTATEFGVRSQT